MIGINRGLDIIFDCMRINDLQLNHDNLSKCCGFNRLFERFCIIAELSDNKVHTKNKY